MTPRLRAAVVAYLQAARTLEGAQAALQAAESTIQTEAELSLGPGVWTYVAPGAQDAVVVRVAMVRDVAKGAATNVRPARFGSLSSWVWHAPIAGVLTPEDEAPILAVAGRPAP